MKDEHLHHFYCYCHDYHHHKHTFLLLVFWLSGVACWFSLLDWLLELFCCFTVVDFTGGGGAALVSSAGRPCVTLTAWPLVAAEVLPLDCFWEERGGGGCCCWWGCKQKSNTFIQNENCCMVYIGGDSLIPPNSILGSLGILFSGLCFIY